MKWGPLSLKLASLSTGTRGRPFVLGRAQRALGCVGICVLASSQACARAPSASEAGHISLKKQPDKEECDSPQGYSLPAENINICGAAPGVKWRGSLMCVFCSLLDLLLICGCIFQPAEYVSAASVSLFLLLSCMRLHHKPEVGFCAQAVWRIYSSFTTSLKQTRNS